MFNNYKFTESMINSASSSPVESLTVLFSKLYNGIQTQIQNAIRKKEIKQKFMPTTTAITASSSSSSLSSSSSSSLSLTPVSPTTCFILVKFKKDAHGIIDIESVNTDFTECKGAEIFTGDFKTMDFGKKYLFQFNLDHANPYVSNVTYSSNTTTCTPALKTQLDSLFAS